MLHPQLVVLLERAAQSPLPPYHDVPPAVARRFYRDTRGPLTPDPPPVEAPLPDADNQSLFRAPQFGLQGDRDVQE